MTRIIISFALGVLMLYATPPMIKGQVTIGLSESPVEGALLQLKNKTTVGSSIENADKGLILPRVALTEISQLFPMFPTGYDKSTYDYPHTGLLVYNANDDLKYGDGKGMYVWDGNKWMGVSLKKRTIDVYPQKLYLSEIKNSSSATLTTSIKELPWDATTSGNTSSSSVEKVKEGDNYKLTYTRSTTEIGNKTYTYTLINNPDRHGEIQVCNLSLSINKSLIKVGQGQDGYVNTASIVSALGGDASWKVIDYSKDIFNWDIAPDNVNGSLVFRLGTAKKPGNVDGQIIVAHINEPQLTRTIYIRQNSEYVILPKFDFLVVRYKTVIIPTSSSELDIDTATEIKGTGNNKVDNMATGYLSGDGGETKFRKVGDLTYLTYGGDNQAKGYETSYVDMINLNKILGDSGPRELYVYTHATWYKPEGIERDNVRNKIDLKVTVYKGGKMEPVRTYDFENKTASDSLVLERKNVTVNKYRGSWAQRQYAPLYRLEYDRIDNTGVLEPITNTTGMKMMMPSTTQMPVLQGLPNESKADYEKRATQYYKSYMEKEKIKAD